MGAPPADGPEAHASDEEPRILCFATQGAEHLDAERLRYLLEPLAPVSFAFDRASKLRSAVRLVREARARRAQLIVMEGTGLAGGAAVLALSFAAKVPFVLSSGDEVGPYLALRSPIAGFLGGIYERLLCRRCAGYIGWTPYLVGRALTFGAPHAMTAPGWPRDQAARGARDAIRGQLGIPADALVVGLVGSLNWRARVGYSYGAELVSAVRRTRRPDVVACIVGDGPGSERLREEWPGRIWDRGSSCRAAWRQARWPTTSRRSTSRICRRASTASVLFATRRSSASTWRASCRSSPAGSRRRTTSTRATCGGCRATTRGARSTWTRWSSSWNP